MHNHVQVRPATEGHPEGPIELQVKDKTVVLSVAEVQELMAALMQHAFETPPPPVEEPEQPAEPEPAEPEPNAYRGARGRGGRNASAS